LACAATFVATSHVLYNAPSSTNVIVGVDGLLQASKQLSLKPGFHYYAINARNARNAVDANADAPGKRRTNE